MPGKSKEGSGRSGREVPALFGSLEHELSRGGFCVDLGAIDDLLRQIHLTPVQDEKEKLRQKDQALVNTIGQLQAFIGQAGWMPQGTAHAFRLVIAALMQVEGVLWELKGERGPVPQPQPRPQG
jgi:hypothetical protein